MINPQWLRSFASLVEQGSFTRAADRLGITQAAVSQHVRQLENQFGALLIRRPRRIELTPAGEALLIYCREAEAAEQRLRQRLSEADIEHGEISLISPGSIGLLLYPMLLELQASHPGLSVRHRFAPDPEVLDAVSSNRYELGIVSRRPEDPRLSATLFAEEALELVIPAGEQVRDWNDLVRLGFIDHPDGRTMATRLLGLQFPGNPGVSQLPVHGFSNQIALILEPVARGLGFTVIPRYAREAFAGAQAIHSVASENPVVDSLWLIHRSEWPLSGRARLAVDHLRRRMGATGA